VDRESRPSHEGTSSSRSAPSTARHDDPGSGLFIEYRLWTAPEGIVDIFIRVGRIGTAGEPGAGQVARLDTAHGTVHTHWFGLNAAGRDRGIVEHLARIPRGHAARIAFFNENYDSWHRMMLATLEGRRPRP
jgi:hypothetical protein